MESDDSLPLCTRPPNGHTIRPPTYSFERHHKPQSGFCQGDPLGPLLFSIGIRDLLDGLIAFLGEDHLLLAYLDDVFILGPDSGILDRVLQHLNGRSSPISLNRSKSKVISFEDILNSGINLLGTCIGPPSKGSFSGGEDRCRGQQTQAPAQTPKPARVADPMLLVSARPAPSATLFTCCRPGPPLATPGQGS